jgi:putative endonuclease
VDLILEGPDLDLIFVEVRSRVSWPVALESIDSKKRRRISRAARAFLWSYRGRAQRVRMDVVIWEGGRWNWIRDAWRE